MSARSGNDDPPAARILEGGFPWLRFPEPLEHEFRLHHRLRAQRWVRLSILVALGTTLGFATIDHWVIRPNSAVPDLVRFGLQVPAILICLLATFTPFYMRLYERAILIGAPLFGMGTVLMACYTEPEHTALVGARLLLVAFFLYFMLGMRLRQALASNALVLGALVAAGFIGVLTTEVAIYQGFALACANVIGGAGAYALEHANRTAFLERKLLGEMAALDGLTRLLNRQTFELRVQELWPQTVVQRRAVSVLMIDVDHFKRYNDRYGHQAGDACLQRIAAAVRTAVDSRQTDLLARYGGEELVAVLLDRSEHETESIARHVVAGVSALAIPHEDSSTGPTVSVSVGAATQSPAVSADYATLARLADSALYTAKHRGRNRYVCVTAQHSEAGRSKGREEAGGWEALACGRAET